MLKSRKSSNGQFTLGASVTPRWCQSCPALPI